MKRILLGTLAAAAISLSALTAASGQSDQQPSREERMQHRIADREAMLDARLGGMKAGLKLTPDQEKLWGPFESAVRDGAKARMENMRQMMQNRERFERMAPSERMETMSNRMAQGAAEFKTIGEAVKPFYASLDDTQKHKFGLFARTMMMHGRRPSSDSFFGGDEGFSWEPEGWDEP